MSASAKPALEESREDLTGQASIERIRNVVKTSETCFLCTSVSDGLSNKTRPMSVLEVDDAGTLWFLTANDSHAVKQITDDPQVRLFFQGSEHSRFLTLSGSASVGHDRAKIKDLWSPLLKTWFNEGSDDPRITTIAVMPIDGYYWDNKHGDAVAGVKMLIGAAIGRALDDSVEGRVKL